MSTIEFTPWPKIARLYRDCVITEKIDGTNAAVGIVRLVGSDAYLDARLDPHYTRVVGGISDGDDDHYGVYAQSRKRLVIPASTEDKNSDNHGFAAWVRDNAYDLVTTLGEGLHFGEWWGSGIERRYGLTEKRFSLFNTPRYTKPEFDLTRVAGLGTVPVLFQGMFSTHTVDHQIEILRQSGSVAAPGFMNPEGVVTYHIASGMAFKTTLEGDEKPKGSNEV